MSWRQAKEPQAEDGFPPRSLEFREQERGKVLEIHDAVARDLAREEDGPTETGEELLIEQHGRLEREEISERPAGNEIGEEGGEFCAAECRLMSEESGVGMHGASVECPVFWSQAERCWKKNQE